MLHITHVLCNMDVIYPYNINVIRPLRNIKLEKAFLRKNIVAVSFYTHILNNISSINGNHSSMNIFSIYIYTCPVNIHCNFNSTDSFRTEILNFFSKK